MSTLTNRISRYKLGIKRHPVALGIAKISEQAVDPSGKFVWSKAIRIAFRFPDNSVQILLLDEVTICGPTGDMLLKYIEDIRQGSAEKLVEGFKTGTGSQVPKDA